MKAIIMHADTPVVEISLDNREYVESVGEVFHPRLLPCVNSENESDLRFGIQRWLLNRTLGRTRSDYGPLRSFYGSDLFHSKTKVSLYDKYWIKTEESQEWKDIDPLKNWDSEEDCYFSLLFDPEDTTEVDNISPNLTLPGSDHRFWYRYDEEIGIITDSAQKDMQVYKKAKEYALERFVSPRKYLVIKGIIYSFRPVGVSANAERVPFDVIYDSFADKTKSKVENLKRTCEAVGLKNWREFFGAVMELDKILGNKERELCEIGVFRNPESLDIYGFELI